MEIPWETNINPSSEGDGKVIGIYKITNKNTGKSYIGQSNDIERRFKEHQIVGERSRIPVDVAIQKYGKDSFTYEIVEQCAIEDLNIKEEYWIAYYDTMNNGYNCNPGGNQSSIGENNGRAKLTIDDVYKIRLAYKDHKKQRDVFEEFKDKISFAHFQNVWAGRSWPQVLPEVLTEENKNYYKYENSKGALGSSAKFSNEEVIAIRQRYVNESAQSIYKDYSDRISFQGLQAILWGRAYKDLPLYKKKEKRWINI